MVAISVDCRCGVPCMAASVAGANFGLPGVDCRVWQTKADRRVSRFEPNRTEPNRTEPNRFGSFLGSGTMFFGFLIKFYARFTIRELKRTVLESFETT